MRRDLVEKFNSLKARALEKLGKSAAPQVQTTRELIHFFKPNPYSTEGLYLGRDGTLYDEGNIPLGEATAPKVIIAVRTYYQIVLEREVGEESALQEATTGLEIALHELSSQG